jgi:hypothetical protein
MFIKPGAETCSKIAINTSSLKSVNSISETQSSVKVAELHFRFLLLRNLLLRVLLQRLRFVLSRFITLLFRLQFVADSMFVICRVGDVNSLLSLRLAVIERVTHREKPSLHRVFSSSLSSSFLAAEPSKDISSTKTITLFVLPS